MADFELRFQRGPGPVTRILGALGVGALVTSLEDQEMDAPDPRVVTWTHRSSALRRRAFELVEEGRDDQGAADELAVSAGRHTRELRRAAASVRQGGWAEEDERCFRVDRLLVAAAGGRAPEPLDDDRRAWFDQVRRLAGLPVDEGFAVLAVQEPGLVGFDADVRRIVADPGFAGWDEARRRLVLDEVLTGRLAGLVDRSPSRLVRTRVAWSVLVAHAHGIVGLAPPDGDESPGT